MYVYTHAGKKGAGERAFILGVWQNITSLLVIRVVYISGLVVPRNLNIFQKALMISQI